MLVTKLTILPYRGFSRAVFLCFESRNVNTVETKSQVFLYNVFPFASTTTEDIASVSINSAAAVVTVVIKD